MIRHVKHIHTPLSNCYTSRYLPEMLEGGGGEGRSRGGGVAPTLLSFPALGKDACVPTTTTAQMHPPKFAATLAQLVPQEGLVLSSSLEHKAQACISAGLDVFGGGWLGSHLVVCRVESTEDEPPKTLTPGAAGRCGRPHFSPRFAAQCALVCCVYSLQAVAAV